MVGLSSLVRCEAALRCRNDGPPPFLPAIYEHKAWFIRDTPSRICRNVELFTKAILAEYEQVRPDALVVGMDVYNVEAEAAGCKVTYYERDDTSIPGISQEGHSIMPGANLKNRSVPNPLRDGRMPINIEVARRVVEELGKSVWIRGALSGPFSLATSLAGVTTVFLSLVDNPGFVHQLLDYASKIIKEFGKAYVDAGANVIIFDSQASSDLLSPAMYREIVHPVTEDIIAYFEKLGVRDVPLIIGGNTTSVADSLIATGANNLLCDFKSDWPSWLDKCRKAGRAIRRNLDPRLIHSELPEVIYNTAQKLVSEAAGYPGFILGTGIVPYGTPTENLLAAQQACRDTTSI
jgi:uroporphyrinogen decarboxylase